MYEKIKIDIMDFKAQDLKVLCKVESYIFKPIKIAYTDSLFTCVFLIFEN